MYWWSNDTFLRQFLDFKLNKSVFLRIKLGNATISLNGFYTTLEFYFYTLYKLQLVFPIEL